MSLDQSPTPIAQPDQKTRTAPNVVQRLLDLLNDGNPHRFLASKVLSLYGRKCLGGPRADQFPGTDPVVQKHLADNFYNMPCDRKPAKISEDHKSGMLWGTQVRQEEEWLVGIIVPIVAALLCTVIVASAGLLLKTTSGLKSWSQQREAASAAEDAREYAAKREDMKKEWAAEIANYTAQKCIDEVSTLRVRTSDEHRDRYAALETGCNAKRADIQALAKAMSLEDCVKFGIEGNKQLGAGGNATWIDQLVIPDACFSNYGDALKARLK